jgi:hypothetical protein
MAAPPEAVEVGDIEATGFAIVVADSGVFQLGQKAGRAGADELIHEIVAENAAAVGEASFTGVEQETSVLKRGTSQDDDGRVEFN